MSEPSVRQRKLPSTARSDPGVSGTDKHPKQGDAFSTTKIPPDLTKKNSSKENKGILSTKSIKESGDIGLHSNISDEPVKQGLKSTLGDIILYNDEGKPYIDVNRLIYRPKERVKKELKEQFSWYFADYVFLISNFLSLVSSAFLLCVGLAAVTWPNSIKSINDHEGDPIILKVSKQNYGPEAFGVILVMTGILNGVNVMIGLFSCVFGYKILLIQHAVLDILILLTQFGTAAVVLTNGRCDNNDVQDFQDQFEGLIRNFTRPNQARDAAFASKSEESAEFFAASQINDIQISMRCCGASNWTDYLNPRVLQNTSRLGTLDGSELVFPFSCCKAWWVRNLHCAEGVHQWASPGVDEETLLKFRERIHQEGCTETVWLACQRLLYLLGHGVIFNGIFTGVLVSLETFSVALQVRSLNTMLREMNALKEPKQDAAGEGPDGPESVSSVSILNASTTSILHKWKSSIHHKGLKLLDQLQEVAKPTEDEVLFIKSRTAYAKFENAANRTAIGTMMNQARDIAAPEDNDDRLPIVSSVIRRPLKVIESPEEAEVTMEELVSNIRAKSISNYGRKNKHKKLRLRHKHGSRKKYAGAVPSHIIKKHKKKHKIWDSDQNSSLEEESLDNDENPHVGHRHHHHHPDGAFSVPSHVIKKSKKKNKKRDSALPSPEEELMDKPEDEHEEAVHHHHRKSTEVPPTNLPPDGRRSISNNAAKKSKKSASKKKDKNQDSVPPPAEEEGMDKPGQKHGEAEHHHRRHTEEPPSYRIPGGIRSVPSHVIKKSKKSASKKKDKKRDSSSEEEKLDEIPHTTVQDAGHDRQHHHQNRKSQPVSGHEPTGKEADQAKPKIKKKAHLKEDAEDEDHVDEAGPSHQTGADEPEIKKKKKKKPKNLDN